jgi:hypothetical protein
MQVLPIKTFEAEPWIMKKHYARRMPSISYAFGLYENGELIGICTYGMPASPFLCIGVCGKENKNIVIELNRLCVESSNKNAASILVGRSLQMLPKPLVVVSYADTAQNHVGYVYQATNFFFTGTTKERTDMAGKDGQHSRHNDGDSTNRVDRSAKHRYVFFVGTKNQKKKLLQQLMYSILPYPKGDTQKYDATAKIAKQSLLF